MLGHHPRLNPTMNVMQVMSLQCLDAGSLRDIDRIYWLGRKQLILSDVSEQIYNLVLTVFKHAYIKHYLFQFCIFIFYDVCSVKSMFIYWKCICILLFHNYGSLIKVLLDTGSRRNSSQCIAFLVKLFFKQSLNFLHFESLN